MLLYVSLFSFWQPKTDHDQSSFLPCVFHITVSKTNAIIALKKKQKTTKQLVGTFSKVSLFCRSLQYSRKSVSVWMQSSISLKSSYANLTCNQ